jgi:hypothetical protein
MSHWGVWVFFVRAVFVFFGFSDKGWVGGLVLIFFFVKNLKIKVF